VHSAYVVIYGYLRRPRQSWCAPRAVRIRAVVQDDAPGLGHVLVAQPVSSGLSVASISRSPRARRLRRSSGAWCVRGAARRGEPRKAASAPGVAWRQRGRPAIALTPSRCSTDEPGPGVLCARRKIQKSCRCAPEKTAAELRLSNANRAHGSPPPARKKKSPRGRVTTPPRDPPEREHGCKNRYRPARRELPRQRAIHPRDGALPRCSTRRARAHPAAARHVGDWAPVREHRARVRAKGSLEAIPR